jgi:hypothetical protein
MAMYQVDGWEGLVPEGDLQNYLDTQQLYEDNWVTQVPDQEGTGWQLLKDVLKPPTPEYPVGTRVQGLYSDGTWYSGTVQGKNPSGAFLVMFDGYETSPPEPCSEVKLEGGGVEEETAPPAPAAPATTPAPPVTPAASVTPASSSTDQVWHVLASDSGETNGPFSVDELSIQLRDGVSLASTAMIHETGTEWVTVGTVASAAAAVASATAPPPSAKEFVAQQTRRKHSRQASKVTVFAAVLKPAPRKKSVERTGSRSAPVKSGTKKYRDNNGYDEAGAMTICQWMEMIIGRDIATSAADFVTVLQTETTIFSELFNAFGQGDTRKVKKSNMRFKKLENIKAFLQACKGILDMDDIILFSANDLMDGKNLNKCFGTMAEFGKRMLKQFDRVDPAERPPELIVTLKR